MHCRNCTPPCSYKEENSSGICPFKKHDSFDVFMSDASPLAKSSHIPGSLYLDTNCWGNFHTIVIDGDCMIEGDINFYKLEVKGNLVICDFIKASQVNVAGNLIITKTGLLNAESISVDGDIFLSPDAEFISSASDVKGDLILL